MTKSTTLFSLNACQLKWIACISMLIDHIGVFLFPQYQLLRVLGRLAFPIFAFMVANGYRHTRNLGRYFMRLGLFAILYQPIYRICLGDHFNIFATLFIGMAAIYLYEQLLHRAGYPVLAWIPPIALSVLAQALHLEYGAYGVILIFTAHLFFQNPQGLIISWVLASLAYVTIYWPTTTQAYALFALPLLLHYNQQRGRNNKWLFYIFYCTHIPLLYLVQQILL